ncbi:hypothetical protein BC829DRAFT_445095 [Chytridium lagenaria]|nr:hypothetical protein BC829DRAFT_445095 [Chytridium lagenaria]
MPSIPLSTFHGRTATTTADESSSTSSSSSSFKSKASSFFSSTNPPPPPPPCSQHPPINPVHPVSTSMTSSHKKKIGLAPLSAGASYASIPVLLHSHDREKDRPRTPDTLPLLLHTTIRALHPLPSLTSVLPQTLSSATQPSAPLPLPSPLSSHPQPHPHPPHPQPQQQQQQQPHLKSPTQLSPPQPTPTLRRNPSSAATLPSVLGPQLNKTRAMELQMDQDMELKRREIAVMAEKEARYADVVLGWLPPSSTVDASGKTYWQGRRERGEVGEEEGMVVFEAWGFGRCCGKMKLELTC